MVSGTAQFVKTVQNQRLTGAGSGVALIGAATGAGAAGAGRCGMFMVLPVEPAPMPRGAEAVGGALPPFTGIFAPAGL